MKGLLCDVIKQCKGGLNCKFNNVAYIRDAELERLKAEIAMERLVAASGVALKATVKDLHVAAKGLEMVPTR